MSLACSKVGLFADGGPNLVVTAALMSPSNLPVAEPGATWPWSSEGADASRRNGSGSLEPSSFETEGLFWDEGSVAASAGATTMPG